VPSPVRPELVEGPVQTKLTTSLLLQDCRFSPRRPFETPPLCGGSSGRTEKGANPVRTETSTSVPVFAAKEPVSKPVHPEEARSAVSKGFH